MQLKFEIRHFIIDNFLYGQDDNDFRDDISFLEKGLIDSTGILELVSFVEEKYEISVADEELIPDNFDSVNKLSAFISKKIDDGK
ncbi:MAG: acyl carrier protein [Nitrospirota bacterium]|nr:acyl carrier protein [Nitrospirota bacterium]MDH5768563.1 acyl carrier protein [Nitrospirota bacterium]